MKMVRDTLVDDVSMRGFLNVTTTGSAPVAPSFAEESGTYPQVIYSLNDSFADPGMDSVNGLVTFSVQVQATGGSGNPHLVAEQIVERISGLFNDLPLSGTSVSGSAVYSYLCLKAGGVPMMYIPERRVYQRIVNYSYKVTGG